MTTPLSPADQSRPIFSRFYAGVSSSMEAEGMADLRRELLADLSGEVIEIGAGTGLNFAHYPLTVTRVIAVEPEPHLRRLAVDKCRKSIIDVSVVPGTAEHLPIPDKSVDAAVLCLVLCSIADRRTALGEIMRVLRPGGTLRFLEHCLADTPGLRRLQRIAGATVWPLLAGGCHTATNPIEDINAAGFTIGTTRRLRFPDRRLPVPAGPHVIGAATTPRSAEIPG